MSTTAIKNKKSVEWIWYLSAFLFLILWFTRIHPLFVLDGDDWTYTTYVRTALPLWKDWNPSRVLPEVLMPLCSALGAWLIRPLVGGDYLLSLTVMHGLVVGQMMKRIFSLTPVGAVYVSALFLILHFLVFREYDSSNGHMFYCFDLTCVYYYLIPALLNSSIVMCLLGNRQAFAHASSERKGLYCAAAYFAIFSNLPASGILAVYAGSILLTDLVRSLKQKGKLAQLLKEDLLYIVILALWLVSAVFELTGGRASADMGVRVSLMQSLKEAVYALIRLPFRWNHAFVYLCAAVVAIAMILLLQSKGKPSEDRRFLSLSIVGLVAIAASAVYTAILSASVDLTYIHRIEYLFGLIFFIFLLGMLAVGYILQKAPRFFWAMPILLCILFSCCNTPGNTYLESNYPNLSPEVCQQLMGGIIDEILLAEQEGKKEVTVQVPVWGTPDNWPHPGYVADGIAAALYEHGVTGSLISVTCVPAPQVNQTYDIPIP